MEERVKAARHGHIGSLCTVTWHLGTLRDMMCQVLTCLLSRNPSTTELKWPGPPSHFKGDVMVTLILCSSRFQSFAAHDMTQLSYAHGGIGGCAPKLWVSRTFGDFVDFFSALIICACTPPKLRFYINKFHGHCWEWTF